MEGLYGFNPGGAAPVPGPGHELRPERRADRLDVPLCADGVLFHDGSLARRQRRRAQLRRAMGCRAPAPPRPRRDVRDLHGAGSAASCIRQRHPCRRRSRPRSADLISGLVAGAGAFSERPKAAPDQPGGGVLGGIAGRVGATARRRHRDRARARGGARRRPARRLDLFGGAVDLLGEVAGHLVRVSRTRKTGSSVVQRSGLPSFSRSQQRVWKRQPDGGLTGDGTSPFRMIRRRRDSMTGSGIGTADRSATVYGWSGSRLRSRDPAVSTTPSEVHHARSGR